jgi:NAD(P)-dependent dehydrogenase (short-subunit alcohol dehydrogenase family)
LSVILITGAGKGIGCATALHFARKGHDVYASLRDPENASELRQAITDDQLPITLVPIDVDDDTSVHQGVTIVLTQAEHIDVLVNNAGLGMGGPLEEVPLDVAQRVFQTNYFGAIRLIQAVLPGMRERRSGTIVNISSIYGRLALATHAHYSASKHALEAASEALAQEVRAFNIRVAIIEPGAIVTPMMERGRAQRQANPPDPANPYVVYRRRLGRLHDNLLQRQRLPQVVAEAIEHAITTATPQLRYLVGEDARALVRGRQQATDEEWVEAGRPMTDEEYYELMHQWCGVDLFR